MSAEVQESSGKRGKGKQKKMTVRVDFTPMVDMNMLLITFFMLCTTLKETSYGADGLRAVLLQKNAVAVNKVRELKQQKLDLKITDDEFKKQVSEIKSGKDTPTVIIKATDDASYMNLIDALDEMQICNIGKYVITDIAEADEFLIKNYDAKGELSQNLADN